MDTHKVGSIQVRLDPFQLLWNEAGIAIIEVEITINVIRFDVSYFFRSEIYFSVNGRKGYFVEDPWLDQTVLRYSGRGHRMVLNSRCNTHCFGFKKELLPENIPGRSSLC